MMKEQLNRIEAKLDVLIAALAGESEGFEPEYDLDGNLIEGAERDPDKSLDD